ncbi:MAG: 50S ribosomal protein L24e [Candidatus Bilamarchaeaceae archaeon]
MAVCSFCAEYIAKGKGIMFVKKDGTTYLFCSSKCRKNLLGLNRTGRKFKWTKASRKFKEATATKKETKEKSK